MNQKGPQPVAPLPVPSVESLESFVAESLSHPTAALICADSLGFYFVRIARAL